MNPIFEEILKIRNGHYLHAVEVSNIYELECIAEGIVMEYIEDFDKEVIINFLETLEIYYYSEDFNKEDEENVYNFNFRDFLEEII